MATNRAMLKEAIADAKAVKETAIANAKAALEEAFTPQLKSMLSMKLQEMNDLEEEDLEETYMSKKEDENLEEKHDKEENMMEEVDLEELLAELEEDEIEEGLYEAEETEEEEISDEETETEEDEAEPIDLEDMTDEDLKSMIEDVIADMIKSGELEAGSESEEEEIEPEEVEVEDEEDVDLAELLREIEEMEDGDKETFNEVDSELTDADYKKIDSLYQKVEMVTESDQLNEDGDASVLSVIIGFIGFAGVVYGVRKAQMYAEKKANDPTDPDHEYWKKALKNMKDVGKAAGSAGASGGDVFEETYSSGELEEAYSTIETLKSELNEINLLNAKLLYTNKIFKSKTLNENQKVKVLSSFDKAKNVGEVKMVFETLNEGIKVSKNTINENLGRASKGTIAPNVKKPIVESNEAFLRMQKLAGII
jgi:hypothetical protein